MPRFSFNTLILLSSVICVLSSLIPEHDESSDLRNLPIKNILVHHGLRSKDDLHVFMNSQAKMARETVYGNAEDFSKLVMAHETGQCARKNVV